MALRVFQQVAPLVQLSAPASSVPATTVEIRAKLASVKNAFDAVIQAQGRGDRARAKTLLTTAFAELGQAEQFCSDQVSMADQAGDLALLERLGPLVTRCAALRGDMRFYAIG